MEMVIQAIQSQAITPVEQAIGRFTRPKLRSLSTWEQWRAGEHKQLDHFHDLKMYGEPVRKPPDAIVLRPHWQCSIKRDGTRRSRICCDGSPQSAPLLHGIASTYSSCVEQPAQQLFFALAARENYRVYGGDAQDAYAHSPPLETPTFVSIDDAYADWYEHRFKKKLDCCLILPVLHGLQGHPESGKLWEKHITAILRSPQFGFKSTTHDRSICSATFEGTRILLLRHVDDFAVACLMKTLPSIYVIRLVKPYNYHLKTHPHSSTSASSKTSMDLMLHSILTPSSSLVRSMLTVS